MVKDNTVRYFLSGGGFGGFGGRGGSDSNVQWVQSACTLVPPGTYGGTPARSTAAISGPAGSSGGMLGSTQTPPSGSLPSSAQGGDATPGYNPASGYAPGKHARHVRTGRGSFQRGGTGGALPVGGANGDGQPTGTAPSTNPPVPSATVGAGADLGGSPGGPGGSGGAQGLYDCAGAAS